MAVKVSDGNHAHRDFSRGLQTKNIVKGAAGGIRGVDYQDRDAEYIERRDGAAAVNLRAGDKETEHANRLMREAVQGQGQAQKTSKSTATQTTLATDSMDARQLVNVTAAEAKTEKRDVKAQLKEEKIKRKLLLQDEAAADEDLDDEEAQTEDEDIEWVGPFADPDVDRILRKVSTDMISRLVQDPETEMRIYGTLRLLDPQDMRAALSTPLRVARHLRVVADRMFDSGEFGRDDVVQYLAGSLINLGKDFGGPALRAFASSVGISRIYPLEVIHRVANIAPSFVPKLTLAPFISGRKTRTVKAGKTFELRCDPDLRITSLALKDGGMPGYQFAPRSEPGVFAFNILTPGRFTFLLLGLDNYGFERLQSFDINVADAVTGEIPDPLAPVKNPANQPDLLASDAAEKIAPDPTSDVPKKKKKKKKKKPEDKPTKLSLT